MTCDYCGQKVATYLVPDYKNEGLFFTIPDPCQCAKGREARDKRIQERYLQSCEECDSNRSTSSVVGIGSRYADAKIYGPFEWYMGVFNPKGGPGLFITGNRGTGKTYGASSVANAASKLGFSVKFTTAIEMLDKIKSTYDSGVIDEHEVICSYTEPDLLVIDDLGKERVSDWSISRFFRVIDKRYSECQPIIVTTDRTDQQLADRWAKDGDATNGNAILRRLRDMCTHIDMNHTERAFGGAS